MTTHVYLKYAIALLMEEYGLQTEQDITFKEIKEELIKQYCVKLTFNRL